MKAVLIERPHHAAWVELETPTAAPGELVVRSHVAGVCRTDLEMLHGGLTDPRWVRFPLVPGHEWSGTVAELGEGVTDFSIGDRVVCEGMIPCNRCRRCKEGATQLCLNYDQIGFTRGGGYGEFVRVPRHVVHRLPDDVSFATGALVEPAACVLRGLERVLRGRVRAEERERASTADRAHQHDSPARTPERGKEGLRHSDLADDIHLELAAELVERDELERRGDRDPGVRDETVELAPDGFGGGRDLLGIRDVQPERLDALCAKRIGVAVRSHAAVDPPARAREPER